MVKFVDYQNPACDQSLGNDLSSKLVIQSLETNHELDFDNLQILSIKL